MLLGCHDRDSLRQLHRTIIDETIRKDGLARDGRWSESLAVGSQLFVNNFATALGERLRSRIVAAVEGEETFVVRETAMTGCYGYREEPESVVYAGDNTCVFYLDESED